MLLLIISAFSLSNTYNPLAKRGTSMATRPETNSPENFTKKLFGIMGDPNSNKTRNWIYNILNYHRASTDLIKQALDVNSDSDTGSMTHSSRFYLLLLIGIWNGNFELYTWAENKRAFKILSGLSKFSSKNRIRYKDIHCYFLSLLSFCISLHIRTHMFRVKLFLEENHWLWHLIFCWQR